MTRFNLQCRGARLAAPRLAAPTSKTLSRAALRVVIPALGFAVLAFACPAQAFTPTSKAGGENTALNIAPTTGTSHASSSGPSLVRTIVGLLIVIAVIWGLTWVLRQVKSGRETRSAGSGLTSLASLPLGPGRTLHLVRAGRDYLLLGSAEHGVMPISRYTEQEALDAGLFELAGEPAPQESGASVAPGTGATAGRGSDRAIQIPGQSRWPRGASAESKLIERLREWTVRR